MRREGETQVLVAEMHSDQSNPSISIAIEAGAHGELMAINSVKYTPADAASTAHWIVMMAISTNPEHEANPPASILEFMESKALYAKYTWAGNLPVADPSVFDGRIETRQIELYGLLRPRRQIWVLYAVGMRYEKVWYGLEINYRPVRVDDATLSEYNHRYGFYKRV